MKVGKTVLGILLPALSVADINTEYTPSVLKLLKLNLHVTTLSVGDTGADCELVISLQLYPANQDLSATTIPF